MDIQFGKGGFAALKGEVGDLKISFGLAGVGFSRSLLRVCERGGCEEKDEEVFHDADFIVS